MTSSKTIWPRAWVQADSGFLFTCGMLTQLREFIELFLEIRTSKGKKAFGDKFNLKKFKSLENVNMLNAYAEQYLEPLGKGSSRMAYLFSSKYALKIAHNNKGLAQNEAEIDVYTNPKTKGAVAKIYDYDPDNKWVVADLVKPLKSEDEFKQLAGIDWETFSMQINMIVKTKGFDYLRKMGYPEPSKFTVAAAQCALDNQLSRGDLTVIDHWGKTADGRVVLLDYGFTEDVKNAHYPKKVEKQEEPTNKGDDRDAPTNAGGKAAPKASGRKEVPGKDVQDDRDAPTRNDKRVA